MLLNLSPLEIKISSNESANYIKYLIRVLDVEPEEFEKFISGIKANESLKTVLEENFDLFF